MKLHLKTNLNPIVVQACSSTHFIVLFFIIALAHFEEAKRGGCCVCVVYMLCVSCVRLFACESDVLNELHDFPLVLSVELMLCSIYL